MSKFGEPWTIDRDPRASSAFREGRDADPDKFALAQHYIAQFLAPYVGNRNPNSLIQGVREGNGWESFSKANDEGVYQPSFLRGLQYDRLPKKSTDEAALYLAARRKAQSMQDELGSVNEFEIQDWINKNRENYVYSGEPEQDEDFDGLYERNPEMVRFNALEKAKEFEQEMPMYVARAKEIALEMTRKEWESRKPGKPMPEISQKRYEDWLIDLHSAYTQEEHEKQE